MVGNLLYPGPMRFDVPRHGCEFVSDYMVRYERFTECDAVLGIVEGCCKTCSGAAVHRGADYEPLLVEVCVEVRTFLDALPEHRTKKLTAHQNWESLILFANQVLHGDFEVLESNPCAAYNLDRAMVRILLGTGSKHKDTRTSGIISAVLDLPGRKSRGVRGDHQH